MNSKLLKGIGNDIVEINRIRVSVDKYGQTFFNKILNPTEISYCLSFSDPISRIAGRFSAKEAIGKALGFGFGEHLSFLDITIENNQHGAPNVIFTKKVLEKFNDPQVLISISHCKNYATSFAIWV